MTKYYIYQTEAEGVYSVSTNNRETPLAQFESSETNRAAILQAADQCMTLTGQIGSEIQITYIFD
ncbi:hypothetical protein HOS86_gp191 [Klebsiella phage vB_KpnM_KpS110]|uniref:Uncharacterized protein n=1 Tax=Klebsiella phage vB_KpnM_KpS110 TaxID=2079262 RepID=A0A2K9VAJ4_9CAUD|nr:hypothetical protein HOS86_gp191 [Klebsiella phage vB_KpnM_KpS110]AUV59231.1 hypothetical protein kps110_115 [Klebsiella phage vB_KpnM_KpS110]